MPAELEKIGKNVMLAYGGSVKRNGVYDELMWLLRACGKNVTGFTGIISNPTYAKVQEGARLARENEIDFILAVGGGSVIDCCSILEKLDFSGSPTMWGGTLKSRAILLIWNFLVSRNCACSGEMPMAFFAIAMGL